MKKLVLLFTLLLTTSVFAQKNEIEVSALYDRQDAEAKVNGDTFKYDAGKDAVGFQFAYFRKVHKIIAVGAEFGSAFHSKPVSGVFSCGKGCTAEKKGTSKVSQVYFNYAVKVQYPKGAVRPFVKGTIGAKRGDFGGISAGPNGIVGPGNYFMAGVGGGADIKLKNNLFWRTALTVSKSINKDSSTVDLKATSGLVVAF